MKKIIISHEATEDIILMYNSGAKVSEITRKYKLSDIRFYRILKEHKVNHRPRGIYNEVMSKIEINKLRDLYDSGMTQDEVAVKLNVVRSTVSKFMKLHNIPIRKREKKP